MIISSLSTRVFSRAVRAAVQPGDSAAVAGKKQADTILQYNQLGSFGLFLNGIRANVQTGSYRVSADYSYRNYNGYRVHSSEYAHNLDLMVETTPTVNTRLQIIGNYFHGEDKRPGSLTKSEFDQDPYAADPRAVNRDETRITTREQVRVNFTSAFGRSLNQKIEISGTGRVEHFLRSTEEFKIINRFALGLNASYTNTGRIWTRANAFSIGGNLFTQPERKEEYENFSGQKSDQLEQLKSEKTGSSMCFVSDNFELLHERLFLALNGKYEHVAYNLKEETLPSLADTKKFHAVTPEVGLDYHVTQEITLYGSYGLIFKYPTVKELESTNPAYLYNQDLKAQLSKTFNAGIRGDLFNKADARFFRKFHFSALFFSSVIRDEMVPYEVYGEEYLRNATETNRYGFNLGGQMELYANLTFSVDYSYTHFVYKTYTANSLEADSTGNLVLIYRDFAGNREPNIPGNKLNLALAYTHPLGKKTGVYGRVSYLYAGGIWLDDANTDKAGAYGLVNVLAGADVKIGHVLITASAGVNNLFDKVFVGVANINSADKRFYYAGAPRNFTGSVNIGYVF